MKKICSLLVLCATVVFASCSKDDPVTEPVAEGITVTTYDALLDALQTGGASADAPTLITLGADITIPTGGSYNNPPINGSGHFKIDGGGHTSPGKGKTTTSTSSAMPTPTPMPFISNSPISIWSDKL